MLCQVVRPTVPPRLFSVLVWLSTALASCQADHDWILTLVNQVAGPQCWLAFSAGPSLALLERHLTWAVRMPARWPKVAEVARKAFALRMRALPYLYSSFFESHLYGCPVMRPMFFSFPSDQTTWDSNTQFMIGDGLLVAPCLQENGTSVDIYFPQGLWYSLYDYSVTDASTAPTNTTLEVLCPPIASDPVSVGLMWG